MYSCFLTLGFSPKFLPSQLFLPFLLFVILRFKQVHLPPLLFFFLKAPLYFLILAETSIFSRTSFSLQPPVGKKKLLIFPIPSMVLGMWLINEMVTEEKERVDNSPGSRFPTPVFEQKAHLGFDLFLSFIFTVYQFCHCPC